MSCPKQILDRAIRELENRRFSAKSLWEQRNTEVERKIPEIREINAELAETCAKLARLILTRSGNFDESLEKIKNLNLQGQERIIYLLTENGYNEDYLTLSYTCPKCEDTGFVGGKRCSCLEELIRKYSVEDLNNRSRMKLSGFDTFSLDYYPEDLNGVPCRSIMANSLRYCINYAADFSQFSPSVFMLGKTGLGKTHLSLAIAEEVLSKGYSVAYGSIIDYLRKIEQEHFGRSDGDTLKTLFDADLLILDDLGAEFESSFYHSVIYNIVNTRLNQGSPTIISSNLTSQELQSRYPERIVSRLVATYDHLKFVGNDVRQLKKIKG